MRAPRPSLLDAVEPARRQLLSGGGPALIALDFDGTLTEIVDDPEAPRLTPERRRILARVAAPDRWLAIVSGRALADVRQRVAVPGALYVGNHGLELEGAGLAEPDPTAEDAAERLSALLPRLPPLAGTRVEDKTLTATVHTRPREDLALHAAVGEALREAVEGAGFHLRPGKASWEIRPAGARTKGDVLRRLVALLPGAAGERTFYAGDDVTDEDAFRALPEGVTARVGPPAAATDAGYHLPSPDAVYVFLEQLMDAAHRPVPS